MTEQQEKQTRTAVEMIARRMPRGLGVTLEDYISAGWIGAANAVRTYQQGRGASLITYISRCARREMVHELRRELRHVRHAVPLDAPLPGVEGACFGDTIAAPDDVPGSVVAAEERARLRAALEQLPPEDRELIEARYMRGISQAGVGASTGRTQSYISRAERRVLSALRAVLE